LFAKRVKDEVNPIWMLAGELTPTPKYEEFIPLHVPVELNIPK
jgi:hypothetical protein